MKKILFLCLFLLMTFVIFSDTILIPENVKEVKSATYSSGGGETSIVYVKILCEMTNGDHVLYLIKKTSVAGFLGMGRLVIPDTIVFRKSNVTYPEWK